MKKRPFLTLSRIITLIITAWAAMLVSCKEAGPAGAAGQPVGLQQPPEAASAEITAALKQQGLGSKLLGLTSPSPSLDTQSSDNDNEALSELELACTHKLVCT